MDAVARGLDEAYQAMREAYGRVFSRCGLDHVPVEADTGNIGGSANNNETEYAQQGRNRQAWLIAKGVAQFADADLIGWPYQVIVGKKASETVHYGHMDKANKNSVYMPLNATSIGYRYNNLSTLDFFKALVSVM